MNTIQKIARNTSFLLLGRIATKIINLFVVIYTARYLGDAAYGKYSFAFAFVSFFTIIADLGIYNIVVREIARSPQITKKIIGNAFFISTLSSAVALFLSCFALYVIDYPIETKKLILVASLGLFLEAFLPFGAIYEVNLEMKYSVIFGLLNRLFLFVSTFLIIFCNLDLIWLVASSVAADALNSILIMIYSRKLIRPEFDLDIDLCKFLLRESLPLALASVFIIIYFRIDVVMLSMMKGDSDVGIYSAAYRFTEAFTFIPNIFMISIFPLMSKYFIGARESLIFIYLKSFKYLFGFSLPLAVLVTFYANEIISILYGNQFKEAIVVLQILIWATAIMFINYSLTQLLVSVNKQKITTFSTVICVFVNIILNLVLIPYMSYRGAALATVVTEFMNAIIMIYFLPKFIDLSKLISDIKVPIIASALMFALMLMANNFNKFYAIVPLLLYPALIYILGGIDNEDKKILKKLIEKV